MQILVLDVGGSRVKLAVSDQQEGREFESSSDLTPAELVERVRATSAGWSFDVLSIGYPGRVDASGPVAEPGNLGTGWVGFDFEAAFGKPTRVANDAALQALGAYNGGRMLFLGLGTGLGSTLVVERVVVPLELGDLPDPKGGTLAERLGKDGLATNGEPAWRRDVSAATDLLRRAVLADYVVLGGGNAARVDPLPPHTRRGGNDNAITGGYRLWRETVEPHDREPSPFWRVLA